MVKKAKSATPAVVPESSPSRSPSPDAAEKGKGKESPAAEEPAAPVISTKKYNPPAGLVATKRIAATESDASLIDCSVLEADPALELWAIRVPVGIKSKHLEGLTIQLPANSTTNSPNVLTTFSAKRTSYDICLADTDDVTKAGKRKRDAGDDGAEHVRVGGQEMKALVPMLPKRSSGDRLFLAPRPITRSFLITRSLPPTILSHLPSATSSLIESKKPSPVPGAVLTAAELLEKNAASKRPTRVQPSALKFRIALAGMQGFNKKGEAADEEDEDEDEDVEMKSEE